CRRRGSWRPTRGSALDRRGAPTTASPSAGRAAVPPRRRRRTRPTVPRVPRAVPEANSAPSSPTIDPARYGTVSAALPCAPGRTLRGPQQETAPAAVGRVLVRAVPVPAPRGEPHDQRAAEGAEDRDRRPDPAEAEAVVEDEDAADQQHE